MTLAPGTRLGPYEVLGLIGAGGMGEVWRARDSRLERDVALKVLPAAALSDETARTRLVREARLASKLNHPHICTIYEVGEADGQVFIAMELVEGRSLSALYHSMHGMVLVYLRRYDDALAAAQASISIRADQSLAFSVIQRVYLSKGMRKEQLADQRLRIAQDPERVTAFERGFAEGGYEGAQRAVADVLAARYQKGEYRQAAALAMRYLDADDKDRAISWLYKAYETRNCVLSTNN